MKIYHTSLMAFVSHRLFTEGSVEENFRHRTAMALELAQMGIVPVLPHFPFFDEEKDRDNIMKCCYKLIEKCDILVYSMDYKSQGVRQEIAHAYAQNIPVFDIAFLRRDDIQKDQ